MGFNLSYITNKLLNVKLEDVTKIHSMRDTDNINKIKEIVGVENIKMFLPFGESVGEYRDIFDSNLVFDIVGVGDALLEKGNTIGSMLNLGDKNNKICLKQKPNFSSSENSVGVNGANKKLAAFISINLIDRDYYNMAELLISEVGDLTNAKLTVELYTDDGGKPGVPFPAPVQITDPFPYQIDSTKETPYFSGSNFRATKQYTGIPFKVPSPIHSDCWIVLEYTDDTVTDANNYVVWNYESTPLEPQYHKRAVYDGTNWVVTLGESHSFNLYNNKLALDSDFSITIVNEPTIDNKSSFYSDVDYRNLLSFATYGGIFEVRLNRLGLTITYNDDIGNELNGKFYDYPLNTLSVLTLNFSSERGREQMEVYRNGKRLFNLRTSGEENRADSRYGIDGYAGHAIQKAGSPLVIGGSINRAGEIYGWGYWSGSIGAILITSESLNREQISTLANVLVQYKGGNE